MLISVVIFINVLVYGAQLWLCLRARKPWMKWIPLALFILGELACGISYMMTYHMYGAPFVAVIYAIILLSLLAGLLLAWLTYLIVRKAQKPK